MHKNTTFEQVHKNTTFLEGNTSPPPLNRFEINDPKPTKPPNLKKKMSAFPTLLFYLSFSIFEERSVAESNATFHFFLGLTIFNI